MHSDPEIGRLRCRPIPRAVKVTARLMPSEVLVLSERARAQNLSLEQLVERLLRAEARK